MECNVLFPSAGRRVELIGCFRRAAKSLDISSRIITADLSDMAPAVFYGDRYYPVPRADAPDYIDCLTKICRKESIRLVVPTIDEELLPLAASAQTIKEATGAVVLVPTQNVVTICRDKRKTASFFAQNGFACPKTYSNEELNRGDFNYPLFLKPAVGSAGEGAHAIYSREALDFYRHATDNQVVQELIYGTEYSVDVLCGFDTAPVAIVPRRRLAVRAGEIVWGRVEKNKTIIADVRRLIRLLRPTGMLTVQCICTPDAINYIEINPRFGGGVIMSILAGVDFPAYLYRMIRGESLAFMDDYADGADFLRCDHTFRAARRLRDDTSSDL